MGVHLCFGETSELTGAEQVCATRGATPEASEKFMKTWSSYNDFILKEATDDLSESQPTAGNIAGGLTTIEEKAFGNFQKIGNCKFIDVLEPAEELFCWFKYIYKFAISNFLKVSKCLFFYCS